MRISTAQFYESSAANYQKNFANVVKSSEEASSLVRVKTAADDPVGAARLLQLGQQASLLDQYKANSNSIKASLGQAESVMTSINNVLDRAKQLAVGAGSAGYTDADRQANAAELGQIEEQLLSLMNSQDENGKYLFGGSKDDVPPFSRNSDGTYSYNGDQSSLKLPVGDTMMMAANSTGWDVFQQALNTSRSEVTLTAPAVDDGRVSLSNGQMSNSGSYNSQFRSGEPYTVSFVTGTQLKITDAGGNDVTAEASQGGVFGTTPNQTVSFRGVDLNLNINLAAGEDPNVVLPGHAFSLASKPDSFNVARSPGNPTTTLVSNTSVTDPVAYNSTFPSGSAILKFTSATDFDLYAAPLTADSKPVSSGTLAGNVATAAGVSFTLNGTPGANDQFSVAVNTHETQNILDTVNQLKNALNTPTDGNVLATQKQVADLASGMANLASGIDQLSIGISSIGGRGSALATQNEINESLAAANVTTRSAISDSDPAEVMTRLTLQQTMLQASQLAFSKIAQLGLFNKV
ncbi:flagellar hook-associated protein 3 [Pseudomonas sp. LD120]|uniref:flagellar hook-associated protein 3 n=1 Tax=Pseudomonas sp. LD120 TaxID=485751 RepID=UPI00135C83F9|nr:flagellar hook-associated protein 3 [Pseudomonas sp. LD120]KAF0863576.1 flagellar hook-associated protein 3 [Pseudomonas sp. LD120]